MPRARPVDRAVGLIPAVGDPALRGEEPPVAVVEPASGLVEGSGQRQRHHRGDRQRRGRRHRVVASQPGQPQPRGDQDQQGQPAANLGAGRALGQRHAEEADQQHEGGGAQHASRTRRRPEGERSCRHQEQRPEEHEREPHPRVAARVGVDGGLRAEQAAVEARAEPVPAVREQEVQRQAGGEQRQHRHRQHDQRARDLREPRWHRREPRGPEGGAAERADQHHEQAAPHRRVLDHAQPVGEREGRERGEDPEPEETGDVLVDPG